MQVLRRTLVFSGSLTPFQVFSTTSTCPLNSHLRASVMGGTDFLWSFSVLWSPWEFIGFDLSFVSRCNSSICVQGFPSTDSLGICSKGLCGRGSVLSLCSVDERCPVQQVGHAGPAAPPCCTTDVRPSEQGTSSGAAGTPPKSGASLKTPPPGDSGSWDEAQSTPEQPHL